jgi:hypothetical protein
MSVHVEEMASEVIPEPEPGVESGAGSISWAEMDRHRALAYRLAMDRARTCAEGFDA